MDVNGKEQTSQKIGLQMYTKILLSFHLSCSFSRQV